MLDVHVFFVGFVVSLLVGLEFVLIPYLMEVVING